MAALMKLRLLPAMLAVFTLTAAVVAQDPASAPPPSQDSNQNAGQGSSGGYGQRGGRGGYGGGMGRGIMGTVTEVTADHYTIKTEMGEVYTVHFGANTRIVKQPTGMRGPGGGGGGQGPGGGGGRGGYGGGNPPQEIKATDIKVGNVINAAGEIDVTAKSVGAMRVVQLNPETVKQIQERMASFGKTWLGGKVTAINETTITLTGQLDNAPHTVVADENTTFRKRRDPVTLADIQVGDSIRVEGSPKNGVFAATAINVGGGMGGAQPNGPSGPASGAPSGPPAGAPPQ